MIYHGTLANEYTPSDLSDLAGTVEATVKDLRPHLDEFDSIVVSGMSGVIVGVPVALALDVPIVIVRKSTDDSHATRDNPADSKSHVLNAGAVGERSLFLDDFVAGGDTQIRVRNMVAKVGGYVAAEYLYRERSYWRREPKQAPEPQPEPYSDVPEPWWAPMFLPEPGPEYETTLGSHMDEPAHRRAAALFGCPF